MPTVVDRMIPPASAQVLGPLFAADFSASSLGLRPGRSAHQAVKQIQGYINRGSPVAVDLDLAQCFDQVTPDAVRARGARHVRDQAVLRLSGQYRRAGVVGGESLPPTATGVPHGSPRAPWAANVRLDDLDKELERRGHQCARYCDDFLLVVTSPRASDRVKARRTRFLQQHWKLESNESTSTVGPTKECVFRGFPCQGTRSYGAPATVPDFRHRLRTLSGRSRGVSRAYRIRKLNEYLRGWVPYFGLSPYSRPLPALDAWLRRRLRLGFWQHWRSVRTKVRALLKRGTAKNTALLTARSRQGPWHLSRTLATQTGMTNPWRSETRGLVSIRALWSALHYPT